MPIIYESHGHADTYEWGRQMGMAAKGGDVIALCGMLGSGKTVLAQGIAAGIGTGATVCSPTFVILHEHEDGRLPLYHFDIYRIGDYDELLAIGFEDYLRPDSVAVIEWADMIEDYLPRECLRVEIEKDMARGDDYRRITRTR